MTARERIANLTDHEGNSVAQFSAAAYGGLRTPREKLLAARTLLCIEPNGKPAGFRGWGIVDGVFMLLAFQYSGNSLCSLV